MDDFVKIFKEFFIPLSSFIFAAAAFYKTRKKEGTDSESNALKLKILQAIKKRKLKESEISEEIDPINASIPRKELLSQLYTLMKDGMITQSIGPDGWVYSINNLKDMEIHKYTFECIEHWDSREIRPFRKVIREFFKKGSAIDKEQLRKRLDEERNIQDSLIYVFNYFQGIGNKIESGIIDKATIYNSLGDAYIKIYEMFFSWVSDHMHLDDRMKSDLTNLYQDVLRWK
jgi:hypothetical protein